jgi:hypothetical protein
MFKHQILFPALIFTILAGIKHFWQIILSRGVLILLHPK